MTSKHTDHPEANGRPAHIAHHRSNGSGQRASRADGRQAASDTLNDPDDSYADREPPPLPPEDERDLRDLYAAPLPEGEYIVGFISDQRQPNFGKDSYIIIMEIAEGAESGRRILFPVPCIPNKKRPRPNFKYCATWVACTGRRLPQNLWLRRPGNFMKDCLFRVCVTTVKKNSKGNDRPTQLYYSKIDRILERVAGTPPCLSGRR